MSRTWWNGTEPVEIDEKVVPGMTCRSFLRLVFTAQFLYLALIALFCAVLLCDLWLLHIVQGPQLLRPIAELREADPSYVIDQGDRK